MQTTFLILPMQHLLMVCLHGHWSYLVQTISNIKDFLQPLEDVIHQFLFQHHLVTPCLPTERELYAFPVSLGGLGFINPCSVVHSCFHDSEQLTVPLVALIVAQYAIWTVDHDQIHQLKQSIRKNNYEHQRMVAATLQSQLYPFLNAVLTLPRNLGHLPGLLFCQYWNTTSTCTRVIFRLPCLCIMASHYLTPNVLASVELAQTSFLVDLTMVCPFGGFPMIRHN